jgi:hypothetical protein
LAIAYVSVLPRKDVTPYMPENKTLAGISPTAQ